MKVALLIVTIFFLTGCPDVSRINPKKENPNPNSNNPIISATQSGNTEYIKKAIFNKEDLNVKGIYNMTPLHFSIVTGNKDIALLLIDGGADYNVFDINGYTPLDLAISRNQRAIAEYLLNLEPNAIGPWH